MHHLRLFLLLAVCAAGWAQPTPDVAWLVITPATLAGTPLPIPPAGMGVTLQDADTRAVAGRADPDREREHFIAVNLKPGRLRVTLTDTATGAKIEELVDIHDGFNTLTLRLPLAQLALRCTRDDAPVQPRVVTIFRRSNVTLPNEPSQRLWPLPGPGLVVDGVPAGDSQLMVLTDLGCVQLDVTVAADTPRVPVDVPLQPGAMADITALDPDDQRLSGMAFYLTSPVFGLMPFTTDDVGRFDGLQLPAGKYTLYSMWQWLSRHPELRSTSQAIVVTAGTPVTVTYRVFKRQTFIGRLMVGDTPAKATRGTVLLQPTSRSTSSSCPPRGRTARRRCATRCPMPPTCGCSPTRATATCSASARPTSRAWRSPCRCRRTAARWRSP